MYRKCGPGNVSKHRSLAPGWARVAVGGDPPEVGKWGEGGPRAFSTLYRTPQIEIEHDQHTRAREHESTSTRALDRIGSCRLWSCRSWSGRQHRGPARGSGKPPRPSRRRGARGRLPSCCRPSMNVHGSSSSGRVPPARKHSGRGRPEHHATRPLRATTRSKKRILGHNGIIHRRRRMALSLEGQRL